MNHEPVKFGPLWLADGISRLNLTTFLAAGFFTIGIVSFFSLGQAYVLSEILKIPRQEQGTLTGNLMFVSEVIAILIVFPVSCLSAKGRFRFRALSQR